MNFWRAQSEEVPLPEHLPLPTGPHAVGFLDIMTAGPIEEGVFVRVYYPSIHPLNETINKSSLWPVWADDDYLVGFSRFMQALLRKWPSWAPREEFQFQTEAALVGPLMHLGVVQVWKYLHGDVHCPILKNVTISRERKWPVIVFSAGLGTSRFAYSRICTDLASHGFVVVAIEHRDGTMALSFTMEGGVKSWVPYRRVEVTEEEECNVRNQQMYFRVEEVKRTLDLVSKLNNGEKVPSVLNDASDFDLNILANSMDVSKLVMAGHSLGGATTLVALAQDKRFKQGIVLDGWMFPLKDEKLSPGQPCVFINSESFMSKQNINRMKEFLAGNIENRMLFIKGSFHQNYIDVPLIIKNYVLKRAMGMNSYLDPLVTLDINVKLMLHFLTIHLQTDLDKNIVEFLKHHQKVVIEADYDQRF